MAQRKHLTRTVEELKKIIKQVTNAPHPERAIGQVFCTAVAGPGRDSDDTCVMISPGCILDITGNIYLGKWVMIGAYVQIHTHEHPLHTREPLLLHQERVSPREFTFPIDKIIGDDVWINQSVILGKCDKIAKGVYIAAGAVVTAPILEEYTIWGGVPARKIGER